MRRRVPPLRLQRAVAAPVHRATARRRRRLVAHLAGTAVAALACVAGPLAAQVRPVIALQGTWADASAGRGADRVYRELGGLEPGVGVGVGVGLQMYGRVGFMAFGETGGVAIGGTERDVTRNTFGARLEFPVARLPLGLRGLVATSLFVQELREVGVIPVPNGQLRLAPPASQDPPMGPQPVLPLRTRSLGTRLELGVERRAVLGTGLFALAGVAAIGRAGGTVEGFAGPAGAGGVTLTPTLTIGLRSRAW